MERRKSTVSKFSTLPQDYIDMVNEVFNAHFEESLKAYHQFKPNSKFEAHGAIFSDEVVVAISLMSPNTLSATTVYASCDFDPKASSPHVQDLISACVDAIGSTFNSFLTPDQPEQLERIASESLSSLEEAPFNWTEVESNQRKIFVKMDKSNPKLEALTDDWLAKHDPDLEKEAEAEEKATENLFVTGAKARNQGIKH